MRKRLIRWALRFNMTRNRAVLLRIANLPPTGTVSLTGDEEKLLNLMVKLILPSQVVTRNGKAVYRVKSIDEMGLWAVLEARRAEDAVARIEAWTGEEYTPKTVIDAAKLDKFIAEQLDYADKLEQVLFQQMSNSDGNTFTGDEEIRKAKNLLGLIQITAELFHCSFEEAKKMNFTDAILAIAKKHDEVEKEKRDAKKRQNKF
jgi:hypothetical protein